MLKIPLLDRIIVGSIATILLVVGTGLLALFVHGVLWLFPEVRASLFLQVIMGGIALTCVLPFLIVSNGLMILAFSSGKDLEKRLG